ncbi:MAG TPA: thiolase domain-containing protein [Nocardioides sp.]|nr:thiolase domain-containing protein [Nocardioides sp.]
MRDIAVVGFAQRQMAEFDGSPTCVELLVPLFAECYEQTGWTRRDVGFWCSGSSDYLAGRSFSFVQAVDAIGVIPPVNESHVEMDLAWAMYEAWIKIQTGEVDTALVYAFGKSSAGVLRRTLALQLEPYTMTPIWPDTVSLAGLQARAGIDAGLWDEQAMAEVANRSLTDAERNDYAVRKGSSVAELLARPMYADPLRKHDCAPVTDGAAALVLAAGDRAREVTERPAWIRSLAHYVDPMSMGTRDLTRSPSARRAGEASDLGGVEVAELHAPFSHQELILRSELGLGDDVRINPSGGALTSNPMFSAGGIRIGEAARRIWSGEASTALGHATSGPALQQNLVCVMASEGQDA